MFIYCTVESIKHGELKDFEEKVVCPIQYQHIMSLKKFWKKTLKSLFSMIPQKIKTYFQDKNKFSSEKIAISDQLKAWYHCEPFKNIF